MAKGRKTGGRRKGALNKKTVEVKQALTEAFEKLGGIESLVRWGKENPTAFYPLWIKLLPMQAQVTGKDGGPIQLATQVWIFGDRKLTF